jgi:hypothetical protein
MTFAQIPAAAAVFLDANTLVYHFTNHPTLSGLHPTREADRESAPGRLHLDTRPE